MAVDWIRVKILIYIVLLNVLAWFVQQCEWLLGDRIPGPESVDKGLSPDR